MAFTKIAAAGIGSTELVTLHSLEVLNNATVGGVLTYEDVTNVDSIGIVTARAGVLVGSGITLSKDGDIFATGVTTSTTFSGNFSGGTVSGTTGTFTDNVDIATSIRHIGDTDTKISFDTNIIHLDTANVERVRVTAAGHVVTQGLTGASYNNDGNNTKVLELTGDGTVGEYGVLNLSGNQNADDSAVGAIKFINRENSNDSSGTDASSKSLATIDVFTDTGDSNAGDDCGGYMRFITKADGGANTEKVRITSTGSVGINQSDPSKAKLHVVAESGITTSIVAKFRNPEGAADVESRIGFVAGYSDTANDSEGHAYIGAKRNGSGNTASLTFTTYDGSSLAERARIDHKGRLLLGTNTARAVGGESNPVLHIEGSGNTSNSWVNITRFQSTTAGPNLQFAKARSNTPGTYTLVQSGDTLGTISFLGADGTDMANYAATIKGEVDGTAGSNDMPGRLVFSTTSDGGVTATERMRIDSNGHVTKPHQFHIEVSRTNDQTGYDANSNFGTPMIFTNVVRTIGTADSALDTSTGKITVPVTGVYFLEASVVGSGNVFQQAWFVEGSSRMHYSDCTGSAMSNRIQVSGMHYLTGGTEVGVKPYGSGSSSVTILDSVYHTWFRVTLVG